MERGEAGLRVTDHKTGAARVQEGAIVGGGESLQPVLYSLAAERVLKQDVVAARLSYCTARGGFQERSVEINEWSRLQGRQVLDVIDRAVEHGRLHPAPREKGVPLVRLPPGVRPARGTSGAGEGLGPAGRSPRAEAAPMTMLPDGAAAAGAATKPLADDSQRRLIREELERNLVVEAAAGTGKTTVLVQRIVEVLASGLATVDRIVAVTFTEKAAGELKLRLRSGLEEARRAAGDGDRHRNLEAALARLEEARVGTIHSFCADLLRERSIEAGVDPRFEPMTEPEAERLFGDAFRYWLQRKLKSPPEGVRRSLRRTAWGSDDGPIGRLRRAGWTLVEWRDFPGTWRRPTFDRQARIDDLVERLHAFADLSGTCGDEKRDNLFKDTEPARRLSREVPHGRGGSPARPRRRGGAPGGPLRLEVRQTAQGAREALRAERAAGSGAHRARRAGGGARGVRP